MRTSLPIVAPLVLTIILGGVSLSLSQVVSPEQPTIEERAIELQKGLDERKIPAIVLEGYDSRLGSGAISPTGNLFAAAFGDRRNADHTERGALIKVYRLPQAKAFLTLREKNHDAPGADQFNHGLPTALKFSRGNRNLLAGYSRGAILWNLNTGKKVRSFLPKSQRKSISSHPPQVSMVAFSPTQTEVLLAGGSEMFVHDTLSAKQKFSIVVPWVHSATYMPDGNILSCHAGTAGEVRIYHGKTGELLHQFKCDEQPTYARFDAMSKTVSALALGDGGSSTRDFYRWNLASGKLLKKHKLGPTEGAWFLPGHPLIAVARERSTLEFVELESGKLRKSVKAESILASNEKYLVSATFFLPLLFEMEHLLKEEEKEKEKKQAPAKP